MGFPNNTKQLNDGRLIVPTVYSTGDVLQDDGVGLSPTDRYKAGCFYSDDGQLWQECQNYAELPMRGAMEPMIEQLSDGRLFMVVRTQLGSIFYSTSTDGGQTWSTAQTTGLRSPESCPAMTQLPQTGDLLMVWNHSVYDPTFDHYGKRTPLSLAISEDDGRTWGRIKDIETDPEWEFTNPSAMVTHQGKLLIGYEASKYADPTPPGRLGRHRMHLKLALIDVDWLYQ